MDNNNPFRTQTVRGKAMDTLCAMCATLDEHKADALKEDNIALYHALDIVTEALNRAESHPNSQGRLNITLDLTR